MRTWTRPAGLLLVLGVLTACGGGQPSPEPSPGASTRSPSAEPLPEDGATTAESDADLLLEPGRIGPYVTGTEFAELERQGLAERVTGAACPTSFDLTAEGLYSEFRMGNPDDLDVVLLKPSAPDAQRYRTAEGIGLDATAADLEATYGDRLRLAYSEGEGGPYVDMVLEGEQGSLVFTLEATRRTAGATGVPLEFTGGTGLLAITATADSGGAHGGC